MAQYPQLLLDSLVQQLISAPRFAFELGLRPNLPTEGGIYRICDVTLLPAREVYVGISGNLRRRIFEDHFRGTETNSALTRKLVTAGLNANALAVHNFLENSCEVQVLAIPDERLRCFAEHYSVAILQPFHNG